MTTLRLLDHREDIPRKLDQIIAGNQLFQALEENLALWTVWLSTSVLCFFPFNYLTFDNILAHPQLYTLVVFLQLLLARHHFAGSSYLFLKPRPTKNKRKR